MSRQNQTKVPFKNSVDYILKWLPLLDHVLALSHSDSALSSDGVEFDFFGFCDQNLFERQLPTDQNIEVFS